MDGYQFPFNDEEEFPLEHEDEEEAAVPYSPSNSSDDDSEDEVYGISNVHQQIIETNNSRTYSAMEYEAELKKRGAPFKHGLVNRYLCKFPFEDEENLPNSEYYMSDDDEDSMYPNAHEVVKRFLKQVRESNGYDVDCYPPRLDSPFVPANPYPEHKNSRNAVIQMAHFAIENINAQTGETYELVQIERNVHTKDLWYYLLTFTVKKVGTNDDSSLKTVRAMLEKSHPRMPCTLEEWMFKAPTTDMDPEKTKVKIGESTTLSE